ncbi:MAG: hypothetical protein HYW47_04305 [Deltaproteobacteria bacterium]|nr:hypothetical protein [Deltaproteobacteria bacterium]
MKLPLSVLFLGALVSSVSAVGPRSLGLSGALRGVISLNESLSSNPASFAFTDKYSIEAYVDVKPGVRSWNASVVDSKTSFYGAALGYSRKDFDVESPQNVIQGALAKRWGVFSLGIGSDYTFNDTFNHVNLKAGGLLEVHSNIHVGLVGEDLLSDSKILGVGVQLNIYDILLLSSDVSKNFSEKNFSLQTGAEIHHEKTGLSFRGGGHFNTTPSFQSYSLGAGWALYKLGFFYGFEQSLKKRELQHSLSMRVFF